MEIFPIGAKVLPESLKLRAKEELNETEENITEGLKELRRLISESELTCSDENEFLLRFLRVKKYNVEDSFAGLVHYTRYFTSVKEQLDMPDAALIKNALEKKICILMPYRDLKGRAIIIYRSGVCLEEEVEPEDALKALLAVTYYLLEDPATQVGGILLIMDVEKFSLSEMPYAVEYCRVLISVAKYYPARFQRIDIVNQHRVFSGFLQLVKPFITTKMSNRITFHGADRMSLMKNYDPWMLPEMYGGTITAFDNDHFLGEMDRVVEELNKEILLYEKDE